MLRLRLGHINAYPADLDELSFLQSLCETDHEVARVLCLGCWKCHDRSTDQGSAKVLSPDLQYPALPLDRGCGAFITATIPWFNHTRGAAPAALILRRWLAPEIGEVAGL